MTAEAKRAVSRNAEILTQAKVKQSTFFFMGNPKKKKIKWPLLYKYIYTYMLPKNRWLNPKRPTNLSGGQMVTQAKYFLCELHPWNQRKMFSA